MMATQIIPRPPDLALGETLPPPKERFCKGCHAPWLPGHACLTPPSPPTTDRRVHEAGVTKLYEDRPNSAGQMIWRKTWRCGHVTVECCQGREAMIAERALGLESDCYPCAFRANRSVLDEEQVRG